MDALADARIAYLELAGSGPDVFIALDERLRYFCWNHAAERLTGIPTWQALGRSFYQLFPKGRGGPAERLYIDVMRTREPMILLTEWERQRYEVTAYPFCRGVCVFARELAGSDRRQRPDWRTSPRFRRRFEDSTDATVLVRQSRIADANTAFGRMLGYPGQSQCLNASFGDHFLQPGPSELAELTRSRWLREPMGTAVQAKALRRDGTSLGTQLIGGGIETPSGAFVVVFVTPCS